MFFGNKYHNKKTRIGERLFDSKREAQRFLELSRLQDEGKIKELTCQVPFTLFTFRKVGDERFYGVKYVADFTYRNELGELIVEDVKGFKTPEYKLKRRLMLEIFKIVVREVR